MKKTTMTLMKLWCVFIPMWVTGTCGVFGQQVSPSSMTLDVRVLGNGTGQGSPSGPTPTPRQPGLRIKDSATSLEIRARNLSTQPSTVIIEWLFYSRGVKEGRPEVFDSGNCEAQISPGTEFTRNILSEEVRQSTSVSTTSSLQSRPDGSQQRVYNSTVIRKGSRPSGWVIRMFSNGNLLRVRASSSEYEKLGYENVHIPVPAPAPTTPKTAKPQPSNPTVPAPVPAGGRSGEKPPGTGNR